MKKWLLLLLWFLQAGTIQAAEQEASLAMSLGYQSHRGYFALSDGSYWKAVGLIARWRDPIEWIYGEELIPEDYLSMPRVWQVDEEIRTYLKRDSVNVKRVDLANLYDPVEFQKCSHLLFNVNREQGIFAVKLDIADCIVGVAYQAYENGYGEGFCRARLWPGPKYISKSTNESSLEFANGKEFTRGGEQVLVGKVALELGRGFCILADGSCWKVMKYQRRWRNPYEWWYNEQLISENYEANLENWRLSTQIAIYPKEEYGTIDLKDASNAAELEQCAYVLVNQVNGQIVFARLLNPVQCLEEAYNDAFDYGFHRGVSRVGVWTLPENCAATLADWWK